MDRFDIIKTGQTAEFTHIVTERDINTFSELTGDTNPLHMDKSYAMTTNLKDRVVHGMLTASFLSALIGTKLPGEGALWYEQRLSFLKPVHPEDRIRVWARVKHKSPAQRVLVLETVVFDESGEKVIDGEAKVKVLKSSRTNERMSMELQQEKSKNKTIIVTGGSRGIGAATARLLVQKGYSVLINYAHDDKTAEDVVGQIESSGGSAASFKADVSVEDAVEQMIEFAIERLGAIYGVVNNASPPITYLSFDKMVWEDIQKQIDVHVKGTFNVCKSVVPYLLESKQGCIVNVASIYADNVPPPMMLPYSLAKSSVVSLTKSLAVEYGPKGIRINCVSPGMTNTQMIANVPEKAKMVARMHTPLRRLAEPEDIANVIAFLFSDGAKHMTGETLRVCGGQAMQ